MVMITLHCSHCQSDALVAVRTYAPRGRTPVLRVKLTRDHLSAIGGRFCDNVLLRQDVLFSNL